MHSVWLVLLGVVGGLLISWAAVSAVLTFVVPRGNPVALTRWVFTVVSAGFRGVALRFSSYRRRDRVMALYAPFALLSLPVAWLAVVYAGATLLFYAFGERPMHLALMLSASSLFTLGFVGVHDLPKAFLVALEAGLGLGLVAILISYLPSIYSSYSRRETLVTGLEAMAGTPPFCGTMLTRLTLIEELGHSEEIWAQWREWFADIEETHTSIPALVFFRSPQPERSWVTAAGAVLDAASVVAASVEPLHHPEAQLCIRTGYLTLRRIADFHGLDYPADPQPTDSISVTEEEFGAVFERLREAGAPLVIDQHQAWLDFSGWRVNYDQVLLELASLTIAGPAEWSSDRAPAPRSLEFSRRRRR